MQGYMRELGRGRPSVDNPYEFNKHLINNEKDSVKAFSEILDKFWLLGNTKDKEINRIYQKEIGLLTQLLDMSNREPELKGMFEVLYFKGRNEFSMTRNMDGKTNERQMMANTAWRYEPQTGTGGYGIMAENAQSQEEVNFFEKLFRRKANGGA